MNETVAYLLTAPLPGPIAVVRVEGPRAEEAVSALCPPGPGRGRARFVRLADAEGVFDEALVWSVPGDSSAVELSAHGSPAVVERILAALAGSGVRIGNAPWEPFAQGGSAEADAFALAADARTPLAARVFLDQGLGALRREAERIEGRIARGEPGEAAAALERLLAGARLGESLRGERRVVIVGRPNAGKSSLFNKLLGRERAIVHPEAGTTRDTIEEETAFLGMPAILVDTAGVRACGERVEAEGVGRAMEAARVADLTILLRDGSVPPGPEGDGSFGFPFEGPDRMLVLTKSDLPADTGSSGFPRVSARTGEGMEALVAAIRDRLAGGAPEPEPGGAVLVTGAQRAAVEEALRALRGGEERMALEPIRRLFRSRS